MPRGVPNPDKAYRRFTDHKEPGKRIIVLPDDHAAVLEHRTLFPSRVTHPDEARGGRLLKSGMHSRKLGSRVVKGRWKGMPIFSLTLEERATCPSTCENWKSCYGNKMRWSERYEPGDALERKLGQELRTLSEKYPQGFVVRLHVLGDFYSVSYVAAWASWMQMFPELHVFGYTAREFSDDIGAALGSIRCHFPDRWFVRWSNRDKDTWLSTGPSGIVCPAMTGASECCGTCGLCWTVRKPIHFPLH